MRARVLLAALALVACQKDADRSLVVLELTADPPLSDTREVTVSVAGVERVHAAPSGLGATVLRVGVFVPASLTGMLAVSATAHGATPCPSYAARATVTLAKVGVTATIALALQPTATCASGADAGAGLDARADGTAGTETGPPPDPARPEAGSTPELPRDGATTTDGPPADLPPPDVAPPVDRPAPDVAPDVAPDTGPAPMVTLMRCVEVRHDDACMSPPDQGSLVDSVAFSPDGSLLATAGDDSRVRLWRVGSAAAPERNGRVFTSNRRTHVAFSPDGKLLAIGSEGGRLELWNVADGSQAARMTGLTGDVAGVGFAPDGKRLVSVDGNKVVAVWSVDTGTETKRVTLPSSPNKFSLSPAPAPQPLWAAVALSDGSFALVDCDSAAATPRTYVVSATGSATEAVAFSPDGALLAASSGDGTITTWTVTGGQATRMGTPIVVGDSGKTPYSIAFHPDGRHILAGVFARGLVLVSLQTRLIRSEFSTSWGTLSVALSADGRMAAGGQRICGTVSYCRD